MGIRFIILLLAIYGAWVILRHLMHKSGKPEAPPKIEKSQDMVVCEICSVHLPVNEAIEKNGHFFCCQEHAEQQ